MTTIRGLLWKQFLRLTALVSTLLLTAGCALISLAQEQLPADMPAEDRWVAKAEMPQNKAYCEHHDILSVVLDCGCFARTIQQYRAAHFRDKQPKPGPLGWDTVTALLTGEKLNCKECISESGLSKWAAEQTHLRLLLMTAKNKGLLTESTESAINACAAKSVAKTFRQRPFVSLLLDQYQEAFDACRKRYLR